MAVDDLRKPFFIAATVLIILVLSVETLTEPILRVAHVFSDLERPGYGILYLASLDFMVLYPVLQMGLSFILKEGIHGRLQGVLTLIVSVLVILAAIGMVIAGIVLFAIMTGLLLSPPFGTAAYFAIFGHFPTAAAATTLGVLMALKLGFAACLLFAHQGFLQNKKLVLLVLTTLLGNLIISFLHGLVPGFLVSITDVIAAIVVVFLAAIWAIVFLLGSVTSIVKAIA